MAKRKPTAAHHAGDYQRRAAKVRAAANSDPTTRCWRCRRTLQEHEPHKNGKPPRWTAGHVIDGDPLSPLLPEASTCNYSQGASHGNRMRAGRKLRRATQRPTSEPW